MVGVELLNDQIYGKHNSVSTIEQVYVTPLKAEIQTWQEICLLYPEKDNADHLSDLEHTLHHYEENKHKLS